LNLRASIDFEADAFPEINPSDWEMILSEFQQRYRNTYLITPIKRTLENKKHPTNWVFFFNDWENGLLLKQYLITQYKNMSIKHQIWRV
jgi:hypothetical protein